MRKAEEDGAWPQDRHGTSTEDFLYTAWKRRNSLPRETQEIPDLLSEAKLILSETQDDLAKLDAMDEALEGASSTLRRALAAKNLQAFLPTNRGDTLIQWLLGRIRLMHLCRFRPLPLNDL